MVRHGLQHQLNALHVMARLVRLGFPRLRALALARRWERVVHPWLYPVLNPLLLVCVAIPLAAGGPSLAPRRVTGRMEAEQSRGKADPLL